MDNEVKTENNELYVNDTVVKFESTIEKVIVFESYCVVLLMGEHIPDNNVVAVGYDGKIVWNISEVILLKYSEAYISLSKEDAISFSVVSYNGVKFVVDTLKNQVIYKNITK